MNTKPIVEFRHVFKRYKMGEVTITASDDVNFEVLEGEFALIVGASGAGKTTVLNMLGGIDSCDEGDIVVAGNNISRYSPAELTQYRRNDVGFVFQFYNLMPNLTVMENVELAAQIVRRAQNASEALHMVGLGERLNNFPSQLSGGEQQRVSIARALAKKPRLLLCDEPTGALDYNTGRLVLKLLHDTCRNEKMTVIVITHNTAITPIADRIITMRNATVESVTLNSEPSGIENLQW